MTEEIVKVRVSRQGRDDRSCVEFLLLEPFLSRAYLTFFQKTEPVTDDWELQSQWIKGPKPRPTISFILDNCWRTFASQHTIVCNSGKKTKLSDIRSEARSVDWFSYHPGYSLLCDDIMYNARGVVDEIERFRVNSKEQADYKRGECLVIAFSYFLHVFICLWNYSSRSQSRAF